MQKALSQYHMRVVFNPAPYPPAVGSRWPTLYPTDWLIFNKNEAQEILTNVCQIECLTQDVGME